MPDPITVTEDNQWAADIAGDNTERFEALAQHESLNAFVDSHFEAQNADWRQPFVGEGMLTEETAKRFSSPADFGKAYANAQAQLSKGFEAPTLPENATEDDIKAFRESQGIPLEVAGYLENLPDGTVIGEDDKPIIENFLGSLHAVNAPPEIAHAAIAWYNQFAEAEQNALLENDTGHSKEVEDELRESWGNEYRTNMNMVSQFLKTQFGEAAEMIENARGPDGRALMNNTGVVAAIAQMARTIDPLAPIIPNNADAETTLNDEIAEIEKFMREKRTEYNKDEAMQARLRELYEIRSKHQSAG